MNFMENIKKIQNQSEKKYTQLKILRVYTYIYLYMLAWCVVCKTYKCLVMKIN